MSRQNSTVKKMLDQYPGLRDWVTRHYQGVRKGRYVWEVDGEEIWGADDRVARSLGREIPEVEERVTTVTMKRYAGELAHVVTGDAARPSLRQNGKEPDAEETFTVRVDGPGVLIEKEIPEGERNKITNLLQLIL